jgi:uncharacterized protein YchJ
MFTMVPFMRCGEIEPPGAQTHHIGVSTVLPSASHTDYTDYNHQLQRHLQNLSATVSGSTWIAPTHLDTFQSWRQSTGHDSATSGARSGYAADRARTAAPDLIAWPPSRNEPCWCGTGRKYKKCCGHPSVGQPNQA